MKTKPAASPEAALATKLLKKARAAETSPEGIWAILTKNASTQDPTDAARFLQALFAQKRLGPEHADAMLALSMPFQGGSAHPEILDPAVVLDLFSRATFYSRGLDALVLLTYPRAKAMFLEARAGLPEIGRLTLDAARARLGESMEPEVAKALVAHFIAQIGVHLPTPDGRIRNAGALEVLEATSHIAPSQVWTDAYAAHFVKPGSYAMRPDVLRRFDEATLVRVLLAAHHLNYADVLAAFIELSPCADPLWAALDALTDAVHQNPFHAGTYFVCSALACLGALASKREGKEVPATFETHVQRLVHGYPLNLAGLDRLAAFFLEAFRALGKERARAFLKLALARDEERKAKDLGPANLVEAVLSAIVTEDPALLAVVQQKIPSPSFLPPSVAALSTNT